MPQQQNILANLLMLAVAPLGVRFPSVIISKQSGVKTDKATAETLLQAAGFGFREIAANKIEDCQWPVLVWQYEKIFVKLPDGTWRDAAGKVCAAPEIGLNAHGLAVVSVPEHEAVEESGIGVLLGQFMPQIMQVAALGILIHAAGVAIPLFSMAVYDRVLPVGAVRTLWLLSLGIALVLALDLTLRIIKGHALTRVLAHATREQDGPLLQTLLRQRGTGTRWADQMDVMRLAHEMREQVIMHILPTLADIPFVFMFLLAIGIIAPGLLPVPLALLVVTVGVQLALLPRLRKSARQMTQTTHQRTQLLLETLRSAPAIRLTNRQNEAATRWHLWEAKGVEAEAGNAFWNGLGQHVTITMAQLSFVLTLILGANLVMQGDLTVGALVATSLLCSRAISPALHLIDTLGRIQTVRAHMAMLRKGLTWPVEPLLPTAETPEMLGQCKGELVLANVGVLRHKGDAQGILKAINGRFGAGERWAVLGGIGAGKSTLLTVLSALVEPNEGEVKLDGVSYSRMPVSEVRRHVALVSQTPVFGDLTVREIIAGMAPVDEAKMREVLAVSGFDTVLAVQGAGLEFKPGANGERISGGQRQMLALAVALYSDPKVLLLDEPTSAFETEAERAFCQRLNGWLKDRAVTLVVVTHREALLDLADYVLVLAQGRAVMAGAKAQMLDNLKKADKDSRSKEAGHAKRVA